MLWLMLLLDCLCGCGRLGALVLGKVGQGPQQLAKAGKAFVLVKPAKACTSTPVS